MQFETSYPQSFEHEMAIDLLQWNIARDRAEGIILDRGWTKNDEDYEFQLEDETKRQWEDDIDKMMEKQFRHPEVREM